MTGPRRARAWLAVAAASFVGALPSCDDRVSGGWPIGAESASPKKLGVSAVGSTEVEDEVTLDLWLVKVSDPIGDVASPSAGSMEIDPASIPAYVEVVRRHSLRAKMGEDLQEPMLDGHVATIEMHRGAPGLVAFDIHIGRQPYDGTGFGFALRAERMRVCYATLPSGNVGVGVAWH